jgi:HEAT repeat protein
LALADVSRETVLREVVPLLIARAQSSDGISRNEAIINLKMLHLPPDLGIPVFTAAVDDKEDTVKVNAMNALAEYGAKAAVATPKLLRWARDLNALVSRSAINALARINPAH